MSLYALATGAVIADPVRREGPKGEFATAAIRVNTGDGKAILVSLIAFGDEAERLLDHAKGDSLAVSGRARLTSWAGRDGAARHGISLVAEQIAATRPRRAAPDRRDGAAGSRASPARHARQRPDAGDGRPFDDRLEDLADERR